MSAPQLYLIPPAPKRTWSLYQQAVFAAVESGEGHLVVDAKAGSGKSTTLTHSLTKRGARSAVVCAFNASAAEELEHKLREVGVKDVPAVTLHGLGFRALKARWKDAVGDVRPVKGWTAGQIRDVVPEALHKSGIVGQLGKAVSWCKDTLTLTPEGIEIVVREKCAVWLARNSPDEKELEARAKQAAEWCLLVLRMAKKTSASISFDDMVFVPAVCGYRPGPYDLVYVDETQDMSASQLRLARLALSPRGRLVLVGDPRQAIYTWRGADPGAMERMTDELKAATLPLSISYRCCKAVARIAQHVVPQFEVPETAPEGHVVSTPIYVAEASWTPGDVVLSRTNAPCVALALELIARDVPARIAGRDMSEDLLQKLERFDAHGVPEILRQVERWRSEEASALDDETHADEIGKIEDTAEMLRTLCRGLRTRTEVVARIERLFAKSDSPAVVFSSTHRAKGLEWERVHVLADTYRPDRGEEEANLWYVAVTRAKRELVLVTGVTGKPVRDSEIQWALAQCEGRAERTETNDDDEV